MNWLLTAILVCGAANHLPIDDSTRNAIGSDDDRVDVIDVSEAEWNSGLRITTCPPQKVMTVEVILCADYTSTYGDVGGYGRSIEVMQAANNLYLQLPFPTLGLRLIRVHRFVGADPFSPSTDSAVFLTSVNAWQQANIVTPQLGAVVAYTSRDFGFSAVELAFVGGACGMNKTGIIEDRPSGCNTMPFMSQLSAHTIGHLVSMNHDPMLSPFIMAASSTCASPPSAWSGASITFLNAFLSGPNAGCIAPGAQMKGDLDCNCAISLTDIPEFVQALVDPIAYQATHPSCPLANGDMNGDTAVNGSDVSMFVAVLLP